MPTMQVKSGGSECVRVIVRCRPFNKKEIEEGHVRIVEMSTQTGTIDIRNPSSAATEPAKSFTFDSIYDWNSQQADLYAETFGSLVESVLSGFNGTIFAYGQTGTGKTYTMEGVREDPQNKGVIPNSFEHIFSHINRSRDQQYLVRASYLEIYQEEIRDLLAKKNSEKLKLKERPDTGVYVKDLSTFICKSVKEIENVMNVGNQNRSVGATNMNDRSSRSHAIFIITVECSDNALKDGRSHIRVGKLNLVDLAGSERQSKTGATGERLKEATRINLSLSALGNVISALVDGKSSYVPYRDSKLTRLLEDSLGGNAKTVMVANIGPASYNYEETLSTLRYANRAKNIKNKPKINEDPKDAILREFQQEISKLKMQLSQKTKRERKRNRDKSVSSKKDEGEDSDSDSVGEEGSKVDDLKSRQEKLNIEKELVENDTEIIAEKKTQILSELKKKESQLKKEREERENLITYIHSMESKLLSGGGKNIADFTNEQQQALEQRKKDIAERKRKEREMTLRLEEQEERGGEMGRTYQTLQQEVDEKTRKLKKLYLKLQSTKREIVDIGEEYSRDRRDLERTQEELMKELKLKYLVIENFIPSEEKGKVMSRSVYDEDEDVWRIAGSSSRPQSNVSRRPVSAIGSRRPVSEYARNMARLEPRFRGENVMRLGPDLPARTTRDYEGPTVAPKVQAALDAAMLDTEEDVDIDVSGFSALRSGADVRGVKRGLQKSHGKTARPKSSKQSSHEESFPSARGLVKK